MMTRELTLIQHGHLSLERMIAMSKPGALDAASVAGRRIRWWYASTRAQGAETKLASDELKRLHLELGAAEVIVHRGRWLDDE